MEPELNAFAAAHAEDVLVINYHPWWTSPSDPFYLHNIADNAGRTNYYQISQVPFLLADGIERVGFSFIDDAIDAAQDSIVRAYSLRKAAPTSVSLEVHGSYSSDTNTGYVSVRAASSTPPPGGSFRIHIALTESGIYYPADNGVEVHDHILRQMYPDFGGSPVQFTEGQEFEAQIEVGFSVDPLYDPANCRLICFLQEDGSREVFQAASVMLMDLEDQSPVATDASWSRIKAAY